MVKPNFIQKFLDSGTLRIGAAGPDFPITMGVYPCIAHDDLAESTPPCLGGATSFTHKTGDEVSFEV